MLLYIGDSCAGNQLSLQAVCENAVPELSLAALVLMAYAPDNRKGKVAWIQLGTCYDVTFLSMLCRSSVAPSLYF